MKSIVYFLLISLFIQFSCRKSAQSFTNETPSIEGVWYYIENDSIYGEIIFTRNHFWTYDEGGGETFLKYRFNNDSIEFENGIVSRFNLLNKYEFTLNRDGMIAHYYRLKVPIDTEGLLKGDEKVFDDYVINGLRERKYKWETSRKEK